MILDLPKKENGEDRHFKYRVWFHFSNVDRTLDPAQRVCPSHCRRDLRNFTSRRPLTFPWEEVAPPDVVPRLTAIRIRAPHQHVPPRVCLVTYENVDTLVREYHSRIGEDRERLRRNSGMKIMISLRYDRHTYRKIHLTIEVGEICDEEFIMKNIVKKYGRMVISWEMEDRWNGNCRCS